jgi:hypothetical protein
MSAKIRIIIALLAGLCFFGGTSRAATPPAGEEALFTTSTAPDALIVLDLSQSMDGNPADSMSSNIWGNSSCSGTFYSSYSSSSTRNTNCSRMAIAKRAIFDILDDNGDLTINSTDETSLGIRIGYMRFYNGDDQAGDYSSGNNKLSKAIGTKYSNIFCNNNTSCTISSTCSGSPSPCVNSESAAGGTPLAAALNEAKLYLDAHKALDTAKACRQKFVILITDGLDVFSCNGILSETQSDMYKRRRESVAKAKALADAGYRLFVIGFGAAMPDYLEKTLNWMAYFGGTDNPLAANAGSTTGYDPSAVTACGTSTTTGICNGSDRECFATTNDPGNTALSGYAFIAADADQLATQIKAAINIVRQATYSFSQSSIQSTRTVDENFIYEGSFQPITGDPFWLGHLKKYSVNANGTVGSELWDAGDVLKANDAASRNIKTYKAGALIDFTTANLTNANLAVATDAARNAVVGYFRGESAYNKENWKLGDIFRSAPITVGTPSVYYDDARDTSATPNAFAQHRTGHPRTSSNGQRVIVVGANDGQLHAFKTSDGSEAWSFIPPNELSRLQLIAHQTEPSSLTHQYYVDGPVTVADAWVPLSVGTGTSKSASDWKTLLLFGEGRGVGTNLWSSSSSCDSGFYQSYTSTYPYYCGYYCLDVTSSLIPTFKWRLGLSSAQAPYMGAPWSRPMIGRVLIGGNEKWVAFIGGGKDAPGAADSGKGFFVIDLVDGSVLWSYTKADSANLLDYPMPAPPAIVDTDNDGLIDTVYLGDLGGNIWRFTFCLKSNGDTCTSASWTGARFFQASSGRPIYTSATVAKDTNNKIWVYWGTGDKIDSTNATASEKIFALKDEDRTATTPRTTGNMEDISSAAGFTDTSKFGWYITLAAGEKVLADQTVFGGVLYATTFTPSQVNDPCSQGGTAKLYGLNYTTGAGALVIPGQESAATQPRSIDVGTGIPSAPVISMKPGASADSAIPDLYVTTSGSGVIGAQTQRANINPPGLANRTNMLYWKDKRVE